MNDINPFYAVRVLLVVDACLVLLCSLPSLPRSKIAWFHVFPQHYSVRAFSSSPPPIVLAYPFTIPLCSSILPGSLGLFPSLHNFLYIFLVSLAQLRSTINTLNYFIHLNSTFCSKHDVTRPHPTLPRGAQLHRLLPDLNYRPPPRFPHPLKPPDPYTLRLLCPPVRRKTLDPE